MEPEWAGTGVDRTEEEHNAARECRDGELGQDVPEQGGGELDGRGRDDTEPERVQGRERASGPGEEGGELGPQPLTGQPGPAGPGTEQLQ